MLDYERLYLHTAFALAADELTDRDLVLPRVIDAMSEPSVPLGRRPDVLLVPGILATSLRSAGRPLWLDAGAIAEGGMPKLKLQPGPQGLSDVDADDHADIETGDVFEVAYGPMMTYLGHRGHVVTPFPFDWRKSIDVAAAQLAAELAKPHAPRLIVAHSMGCLVTRRCMQRYPDLVGRLNKAVFIAPPFRGSFTPLMVATGQHWAAHLVQVAASQAKTTTPTDIAAICTTFPGLAEMIALEDIEGSNVLADGSAVEKFAGIGDGVRWRRYCERLVVPEGVEKERDDLLMGKKAITILGLRRPTPVGAKAQDGRHEFLFAHAGDDTVPASSAWNEHGRNFEGHWSHSFMLAEPRVFTAVARMLAGEPQDWLRPAARPAPALARHYTPEELGLRGYEALLLNPLRGAGSILDSLFRSGNGVPELWRQAVSILGRRRWNWMDVLTSPIALQQTSAEWKLEDKMMPVAFSEVGRAVATPAEDAIPLAEALLAALERDERLDIAPSPKLAPAAGVTLTPDLAAWPKGTPRTAVPAWCAEILTPDRAADIRRHQLRVHAALGVRHVWLVDPVTKLVEVYRMMKRRITLVDTVGLGETHRLPPFATAVTLPRASAHAAPTAKPTHRTRKEPASEPG